MEEQNLSQKMSQLSTSTTNQENESLSKEIKADIEKVPYYLTKKNKSFGQMLYQALSLMKITTTNNNIEELRKIAILIYKIMVIQTYQLLWAAYLKSGMGQLIIPTKTKLSYSTTVSIWPKEIKNMIKNNENESCLELVNHRLYALDQYLKKYRMELNMKANSLHGYTLTIQKMIETYIEENLQSLRVNIEHQVKLVYFDYHIDALKLEYFRHKPNEYQVCFFLRN
jgi:hypothetical protein